jgi:hypothetical protein
VQIHRLDQIYVDDKRIYDKSTPFIDFVTTSEMSPIEYAGIEIVNGLEYVHRDDEIRHAKNIIDPLTVRATSLLTNWLL